MNRLLIVITALILLIAAQPALAKSNVDKAHDLITIGKNYEAQSLLNSAIINDPLNADLHYEAGLLYLRMGDTREFDLAMENACKLKSANCPKVADYYYNMGHSALDSERNTANAYRSYTKAFEYNPAKRNEALARVQKSGLDWLGRGEIDIADSRFELLTRFDPSRKEHIGKQFFEQGRAASPEGAIMLFEKAVKYDPAYKKQAGDALAEMAKEEKSSQDNRDALKRAAGKYLGKDEMLVHFPPDFRELEIMEIYETPILSKGDISPIWIRGPQGISSIRQIESNHGFSYLLRDGTIFNREKGEKLPDNNNYDVKIISHHDGTLVKMRFRKP